jgi:TonB family protein
MLGLFFTAYTIVTPHFQYKNGTNPQEQEIAMLLLEAHAAKTEALENSKQAITTNAANNVLSAASKETFVEVKPGSSAKKQTTEPSETTKALTDKFIASKAKLPATNATLKSGKDSVMDDLFGEKKGLVSALPINKPQRTTSTRIGVNLTGRSIVVPPAFLRDTKDEGTVVVEITVNKAGEVIEAVPNGRGTTTSNAILRAKATQAAKSTKFNADERFEEQKGTLTIVFSFN